MKDSPNTSAQPAPIPPDDPERSLTHVRPDEDENLPHVGVVGTPTPSFSGARTPPAATPS